MNDDIVVHVDNLGKCFKLYPSPWHRVFEWIRFGKQTYHQPFWALREVSFEVRRGEFLGVIGQNGAGKSTLLKILAGILRPTIGTCHIQGKVLLLFGLNTSFNVDLSGKENIIRSAELLNFPNGYIQERMEQIADFSELGEFFERPVKVYSTGMRTRLAFSLFAFLDCDVLILDEVLATGDIFFKQKCYARLEALIKNHTTIILVTHAMNVVRHYCNNVILLNKGGILYQGDPGKVIQMYFQTKHNNRIIKTLSFIPENAAPTKALDTSDTAFWSVEKSSCTLPSSSSVYNIKLIRFTIYNQKGEVCMDFTQGEQACFCCEFQLYQTIGIPITSIMITNQFNVLVHAKSSLGTNSIVHRQVNRGEYIYLRHRLKLALEPGPYVFGIAISTLDTYDYEHLQDLPADDILQNIIHLYHLDQVGNFRIMPYNGSPLQRPFWGMCDLPGDTDIQVVSTEKKFSCTLNT